MPARKIVTLHAPMSPKVADKIMSPAIEAMETYGFQWWFSTEALPDVVLVIDSPQVWLDRAPTAKELERFQELWDAGMIEAAHAFAQKGLPRNQR